MILLVIATSFTLEAKQPKQTKRTVSTAQKEQQASQKKITETQRQIKANTAKTKEGLARLNVLRGEINQKEREITATRSSIDSLDRCINVSQDSLTLLNQRLETLKATYVKALRRLQGSQYATNEVGFIFSSRTFASAFSRVRYLQEFARWRKRRAAEIRRAANDVEQQNARLTSLRGQRSSSLSQLNSSQASLVAKQSETDRMVTQLQRDGANLQKALEEEKRRLRNIDNEITRMIEAEKRERERQERERKERERKEREKKKTTPSTPAKPADGGGKKETPPSTPSTPTPPASPGTKPKSHVDNSDPDAKLTEKFAKAQGTMMFPVAGPYKIISKFGSSAQQPNNTGIEILLEGSPNVRSIFEGTVSRIFQNHDGNYTIMVRHGAYISVYYNIASPSVKAKANVTAGQTLGRAAVDSRYGKPMLHFEIRRGAQTLNPQSWVR